MFLSRKHTTWAVINAKLNCAIMHKATVHSRKSCDVVCVDAGNFNSQCTIFKAQLGWRDGHGSRDVGLPRLKSVQGCFCNDRTRLFTTRA